MKNKQSIGVIMIIFTALLWSSNAPFVRWISLDAFTVAGIRALIAGVVLLPFARPKKINFNWYFLGFILCFFALTFGIIVALKTTSSAIALGMQYTSCILLFLISKPKRNDFAITRIWPMLLILVGVVISMCAKTKGSTLLGNLIALSTCFSFAGLTWFAKKLNTDNPIGLSSISNLILGVVALIIARPSGETLLKVQTSEWLVLVYLGVFQMGISYALYYSGLRFVSSTTASMIAPLEMILGPIWTAIFLNEIPDLIGLIGFIIVIIGVVGEAIMMAYREKKQKNENDKKTEKT